MAAAAALRPKRRCCKLSPALAGIALCFCQPAAASAPCWPTRTCVCAWLCVRLCVRDPGHGGWDPSTRVRLQPADSLIAWPVCSARLRRRQPARGGGGYLCQRGGSPGAAQPAGTAGSGARGAAADGAAAPGTARGCGQHVRWAGVLSGQCRLHTWNRPCSQIRGQTEQKGCTAGSCAGLSTRPAPFRGLPGGAAAVVPSPGQAVYAAAKSGLRGYFASLTSELSDRWVHCNRDGRACARPAGSSPCWHSE